MAKENTNRLLIFVLCINNLVLIGLVTSNYHLLLIDL